MHTSRRLVRKYSLLVFFGLAFAIAMPAFALNTPELPVAIQLVLLMLGSYAPAVAALAVLDINRDETSTQALRKRTWRWRVGKGWYALAFLLPTAVWLVSSVVDSGMDAIQVAQLAQLATLPIIFVTNFGEEIGWRGYALPRLMDRMRPMPASLVLGAIWGLFHTPLYWGRPVYIWLNFALTIALAIILTWLFLNTGGSVPLCTLFHAVFNAWGQVFLSAEGAEVLLGVTVAILWLFAGLVVLRYGMNLARAPLAHKV